MRNFLTWYQGPWWRIHASEHSVIICPACLVAVLADNSAKISQDMAYCQFDPNKSIHWNFIRSWNMEIKGIAFEDALRFCLYILFIYFSYNQNNGQVHFSCGRLYPLRITDASNACVSVPVINSLWPSDAIWRQRFGSPLAQVMACCLTAPSHYLNQCWLMISEVLWHSAESNFTENTSDIYRWNEFEIY